MSFLNLNEIKVNTKRPGFSARQIIETEQTELDLTFNSRYKVYF